MPALPLDQARTRLLFGILALLAPAFVPARTLGADPPAFTVLSRTVAQDKMPQEKTPQDTKWFWQTWQVDYLLRLDQSTGVVLTPAEISATVEGWVSNSRVPGHSTPRFSSITLAGTSGLSALADVIDSSEEAQRCRERGILHVCSGDGSDEPAPVIEPADKGTPAAPEPRPIVSIAPGGTVCVRLRLVHQHFLYGMYDPLLGRRTLELRLGSTTIRDELPLDREHHLTQATSNWSVVPEERRDTHQFVSAPDSLHLEAHVPGNQYYRFPEQPIRYATKMRLRYWYLIAPGTEGDCKARIAQYKDTPTAWKVLADGAHEECLTVVGRWMRVERTFRTEPDATTLALDFRITSPDVGEMWIDDVVLEPVGAGSEGP